MSNFNFNSRTTYLQYRAEWKAAYKELSQQIREAKKLRAEAATALNKRPTGLDRPEVRKLEYAASDAASDAWSLKGKAYYMMIDLGTAKVEAQRQYLAAMENVNVN